VRIERGGTDTGATRQILGKLRFGDFFGELAVLIEETRGVPVRYTRSAYAVTSNCVLMALSHWDMVVLRRESEAVDAAVMRAVKKIKAARPSLFAQSPSAQEIPNGNEGDRLSRLEEKVDRILSSIGEPAARS
jgi:CRP-like cAMP-binding protein